MSGGGGVYWKWLYPVCDLRQLQVGYEAWLGGLTPADCAGHRSTSPSTSTMGEQHQSGMWAPAQQLPASPEGSVQEELWKRLFWEIVLVEGRTGLKPVEAQSIRGAVNPMSGSLSTAQGRDQWLSLG